MLRIRRGSWPVIAALAVMTGLLAVPSAGAAQQSGTKAAPSSSPAGATMIFTGIRGRVVALDRDSGKEIWSVHLSGGDFVNVVYLEGSLYAATKGEVYCLEAATGKIRWHNALKGYGRGLMTIAASGIPENQGAAVSANKRRKEQEAAAAAAVQPIN